MIQLNELMRGNLVWENYSGLMIVSAINPHEGMDNYDEGVYLRKTFGLPSGFYKCKNIKPIGLNEDWLIKLGFTKDPEIDYRWYLLDGLIAYDLDDNCIRISDSWEFGKRKYVHEIQNLIFQLSQ